MKKVYKCRDCGFIDNPPPECDYLDKCPYCRNDDWKAVMVETTKKKKVPRGTSETK